MGVAGVVPSVTNKLLKAGVLAVTPADLTATSSSVLATSGQFCNTTDVDGGTVLPLTGIFIGPSPAVMFVRVPV